MQISGFREALGFRAMKSNRVIIRASAIQATARLLSGALHRSRSLSPPDLVFVNYCRDGVVQWNTGAMFQVETKGRVRGAVRVEGRTAEDECYSQGEKPVATRF